MISSRPDVVGFQYLSQFLHLLSRQTVDDAALSWVLFDETDDILVDLIGLGAHLIIEVRTVERTLELVSIQNAQVLLDIRTHLVGSCCRQGNDGCIANLIDDRTDTAILRTEVMTPFRDTVSLVYGIE